MRPEEVSKFRSRKRQFGDDITYTDANDSFDTEEATAIKKPNLSSTPGKGLEQSSSRKRSPKLLFSSINGVETNEEVLAEDSFLFSQRSEGIEKSSDSFDNEQNVFEKEPIVQRIDSCAFEDSFDSAPQVSTCKVKADDDSFDTFSQDYLITEIKEDSFDAPELKSNYKVEVAEDSFNTTLKDSSCKKEINDDSFDLREQEPFFKIEETEDSFDAPLKKTENTANEAEDSFDSPFQCQRKEKLGPTSFPDSFDEAPSVSHRSKKLVLCDSGIEGFPSLNNPGIRKDFKIVSVEHSDGMLTLECTDGNEKNCMIYLQGLWSRAKVEPNMRIKIIGGKPWGSMDFLVDDCDGVLIVEPDVLIPSTAVASATWCPRKTVLHDKINLGVDPNKAMLIGCIVHELFQVAVQCPDPSKITNEWVFSHWKENISASVMESFVALSFSPKGFETELKPYAEIIVNWIRNHVPNKTKILCKPLDLVTKNSLIEVHDIEENVWEPLLGIKGKIDATLFVKNKNANDLYEPLELKTGKSKQSFEHAGQVLLYCLMLSIRYQQPIRAGSLLYLKDGVSRVVDGKSMELKGILQQRNNIAFHLLKDLTELPEPRNDPHFCGKCDYASACSLLQVSNGSRASEKFVEFAKGQTSHLSSNDIEYFKKWVNMINKESINEKKSKNKLSDLWKVNPDKREARGTCIAFMKLLSSKDMDNCVHLVFERECPFPEGIISTGDMCTVSSNSHHGILLSFVVACDHKSVTIRSERLHKILKLGASYHLDTYSSFSTYASTLGNVVSLMGKDELSTRHREMIVSLAPPELNDPQMEVLPTSVQSIIKESALNDGQQKAVIAALISKDYCLIEGLPGTGKTTTIAVLVRCLVAQRKSVLLTSYTNSAVDNILLKLMEMMPEKQLLRIGSEKAMKHEVQHLSLLSKLKSSESEETYKQTRSILKETLVICCTCHNTARDVLFSWRKFDVCIVDEASMVLEPVILSAIATAKSFVLVGDKHQLAPLVQDPEARKLGMAISLFERLSVHNHSTFSLVAQYRMNRNISRIASELFYQNRMICGNKLIEEGTLDAKACSNFDKDWKGYVLSDEIEDSCIFVDTNAKKIERNMVTVQPNGCIFNDGEAETIKEVVNYLVSNGVEFKNIGVMCVYRKQVDVVRKLLPNKELEINTVDMYQGRDKSVIIWSLVWTNTSEKKCDLLNDHRRINVALTRAKHKLITVGCLNSMKSVDLMKSVTTYFKVCNYEN